MNRQDISIKYNLSYSKIVEQYLQLLGIYRKKLNHDKVALLMCVGDFYEIYGLVYNDTTHHPKGSIDAYDNVFERDNYVGNLWEVAEDLVLRIGKKNQCAYGLQYIDVYMAGIPTASLDKYINVAVESWGWSVIVVEQETTIDPVTTDKKITRFESMVISPGTNSLSSDETNTLMVIYLERVPSYGAQTSSTSLYAGIAFMDCLTGECGTVQYPTNTVCNDAIIYDEIMNQLTIRNPAEVVVYTNNLMIPQSEIVTTLHLHYRNHKITMDAKGFKQIHENTQQQVTMFTKIFNFTGINHIFEDLNLWNFPYCRIALSVLLEYITLRNPNLLEKIERPNVIIQSTNHLVLANNALEQLNIINPLGRAASRFTPGNHRGIYDIIKRTATPMGQRLFKQRLMNPITNPEELDARYTAISDMIALNQHAANFLIPEIKKSMCGIADLKRIERQLAQGTFPIYHMTTLIETLKGVGALNQAFRGLSPAAPLASLKSLLLDDETRNELNTFKTMIDATFRVDSCVEAIGKIDANIFKDKVFASLDAIQADIDADNRLLSDLITAFTDMVDKKDVINLGQNTQYGHYLYTTPQRVELIKRHFESRKGALVVGGGRYSISKGDINYDVIGKGKVRLDLECIKSSGARLAENTTRLRTETLIKYAEWQANTYSTYHELLDKLEAFVATIDLIQSGAVITVEKGLVRPRINKSAPQSFINVRGLRHPIIEEIQTDIPYVANDIVMGSPDVNGILLFGVNAVGKSSLMKSIGIAVIMAQAGFFVAASELEFKPYDYLFTRIQSNDNIYAGMSSFAVEMSEFKIIMKYANANSIILGDELCSGTETLDATALVAAGINKLAARRASFIFATHLHYLSTSKYIKSLPTIRMVHLSVVYDQKTKSLIYERKLRDGSGPSSYGIEVCKAMNMDDDYMDMAQKIREELSDASSTSVQIMGKQSVYNQDKILTMCEVCKCSEATDTHHIKFQCSADTNKMIEHWHKDSKFNLVGLCKPCHQRVHASPATLKIIGYRMTSSGVELEYNDADISTNIPKLEPPEYKAYDDVIIRKVKEFAAMKLTPKAIQVRLKTLYEKTVKITEIKEIVASG